MVNTYLKIYSRIFIFLVNEKVKIGDYHIPWIGFLNTLSVFFCVKKNLQYLKSNLIFDFGALKSEQKETRHAQKLANSKNSTIFS